MDYEMKADALEVLTRTMNEARIQEVAQQRLIREALAGRQARHKRPVPALLDWAQRLAKRQPRSTPEPAS